MCTLLQAMMLLDNRYEGYEFASISADEIMRYASHIKKNYSEEQKARLYDIIDYLEKVFPEKDKMLKKINIPIVMLAADTAMGDGYDSLKNLYRVGPKYFRQWFCYFFDECYEDYKQYCSSGSIKKEKTLKRIEVMESSLMEYFELSEAKQDGQDSSLLEENFPSAGPDRADGGTPLADAVTAEEDSPIENEAEISGLQEQSDPSSVAEGSDPYTASGQAETSGQMGKKNLPKKLIRTQNNFIRDTASAVSLFKKGD